MNSERAKAGGLPGNYLLLKRADHVRVTHVLVYQQPAPQPRLILGGIDTVTAVIITYALLLLLFSAYSQGLLPSLKTIAALFKL